MENLGTLPTSLTLNVDGKPVVVTIPPRVNAVWWAGKPNPVDLPQLADADAKVTMKEWLLLEALAWDCYNSCSPENPAILYGGCWSWSVCSGFGRGAGGVVASLVKKGLVNQGGVGKEACLNFTALGWTTWLTVRNRRIARGAEVRAC